jgi:hypothetical protein
MQPYALGLNGQNVRRHLPTLYASIAILDVNRKLIARFTVADRRAANHRCVKRLRHGLLIADRRFVLFRTEITEDPGRLNDCIFHAISVTLSAAGVIEPLGTEI